LYPFLFSLYPVLFLYLRNIREVALIQALWAAAASLGIAGAGWFLTRLFSGHHEKRALILFLFLLLFHFYGLYYALVEGWLFELTPIAAHALAFTLPGAAWIFLTCRVCRSQRSMAALGRALSAAVLLLLAWNSAGICIHHARLFFSPQRVKQAQNQILPATPSARPDIYCFVLDEFAAPEALLNRFGYDNPDFADGLRRMGFFVAEQSRSRFALTEPAIAAILNLGETAGGEDPFLRVRRNFVAAFLKGRGYRVVDFASQRSLFMDAADRRHYYRLARASIFFDDFYRSLFERSLLRLLPDHWRRRKTDLTRYYRERILRVFSELPAEVKSPGPKFVFVHLFSPHEPFVFAADGGPVAAGNIWNHADPGYYLGQYAYISRRMREAAAMILRDSPAPPVILIQSDHGYRGSRRPGQGARAISPGEMRHVFNALYLPGVVRAAIDRALSPENNFRLVFNSYFGTSYPLLRYP